jgi:hypothetical protein
MPHPTVKIAVKTSKWKRSINAAFSTLLFLSCGIAAFFVREHLYPSNTTVSVDIPQKPKLPGSFAAFISQDNRVLLISNAAIKIIKLGDASELGLDAVRLQSARDFATGTTRYDGTRVFLIRGVVDLTIGPMDFDQRATMSLAANRGDLTHVSMKFDGLEIRGPPPKTKPSPAPVIVYLDGRIRSLQGPAQYKRSQLLTSIIDLSCSEHDYEAYVRNAQSWLDEVARQTAQYGPLPESEIWNQDSESGTLKLQLVDGRVYPAHGTTQAQDHFNQERNVEAGKPGTEELERVPIE